VCRRAEDKQRIQRLKNFGIVGESTVLEPGINGKMSELAAAYGLLQLDLVDVEIRRRKSLAAAYGAALAEVPGLTLLARGAAESHNYAYYPVRIDERYGLSRDDVHEALAACNIMARRYFYPLVSRCPSYAGLPTAQPERLPVAERFAEQVLCLPLYGSLPLGVVESIGRLLSTLPTLR
jgi:dTDP-4-amino-4,6-dideoxygalactose transaminase